MEGHPKLMSYSLFIMLSFNDWCKPLVGSCLIYNLNTYILLGYYMECNRHFLKIFHDPNREALDVACNERMFGTRDKRGGRANSPGPV